MFHELQTRNHTRFFKLLDKDGDGRLTWRDHELVLESFAAAVGLPRESPAYAALHAAGIRNWEELKKLADTNRDGAISLDEWLAHYDRMLAFEEGYRLAVAAISEMLLGLADHDRDGKLTVDNYRTLLSAYDVDGDSAAQAFRRIDLDGDGLLTKSELMTAVEQYVRSANPSDPGHWLFGPQA